jgi:hypothetical protein
MGSSRDGVKMRTRTSVPAASGGNTNVVSGQSQFLRDPLHPLFVNSCGIEEHGQLGAREWLIRKNIEMDILKNGHWLPTPLFERNEPRSRLQLGWVP